MADLPQLSAVQIGVVGLGYVGLPVAVAFARAFPVTGFDINAGRVRELSAGHDRTGEVGAEALRQTRLALTADPAVLADCNVFIVTVPTPIDAAKRPDLGPLIAASRTIGRVIRPGGLVIFESTVYPGATEEDCAPVIARESGLMTNRDFFLGYSPERINPGDMVHRFETIVKVTSGSTPEAADLVDRLYGAVVTAGTHRAPSIRVAEAAKVIENTQRDVNIALINELATLFDRLGIDTLSVLEASATKWNFLNFRPGLVGGHCIGVDPYYLTHKAQEVGHHPEVILAGRRINDAMGRHVATRLVKRMMQAMGDVRGRRVLVMGLTFKENCPDVRNTKVIDVVAELRDYALAVDVIDPRADRDAARHEYGLELIDLAEPGGYDGVLVAVAHDEFKALGPAGVRALTRPGGIVFDLKGALPMGSAELRP